MSALWFLTAGFPNKILYFSKSMLHTLTEAKASGQAIPKCVANVSYCIQEKKYILYYTPYGISLP
jgi:hypothetical protein